MLGLVVVVHAVHRARDDDHDPTDGSGSSANREVTMTTVGESNRPLFSAALFPVLAGAVLALPLVPGQTAAAEVQPNALRFGSVRVGATVEGSIRIFRQDNDTSKVAVKVEPPAFLRVDYTHVGSQRIGANNRGYCDIWVSVDTRRAGEYSGELRVELGREQVAIPVGVTVRPQMPHLTRLLVVETPYSRFSTRNADDFATWRDLVEGAHLDVHYLEGRPGAYGLRAIDLAKFDVVLLGMEGLIYLRDSDIGRLELFTERGGRTIVAANRFFRGTVSKANELLVPYGLRMIDTEPTDRPEFALGAAEIADDPLTQGVKTLYFHRPSPVAVTDSHKGKILVAAPAYPGEGFVAVARAGEGEVVTVGESLWWSWLSQGKAKGSDNATLLRNLLEKTGSRK
jgi:hypothetical protein